MNSRPRFRLITLALSALLLFGGLAPAAHAQLSVNVSVNVFHDALAPYGKWVQHRTYGQVWYPRNVDRDWRPYTNGYWAHTIDYGWLWVADEPWGWAPFHYGRWAWDDWYGWIWVPGRVWAPAWVFWRSGGGYAAWTPMPPNVVWQPGIGINISYFNYDRDLRWDSWVAVRESDLPDRHLHRRIYTPRQNRQIINVTQYTQNVTIINNTIVNPGVPAKHIEDVTHRRLTPVAPTIMDKPLGGELRQKNDKPTIIRLPLTPPTHQEIHQTEELARRLDGKNPDGTRTTQPAITQPPSTALQPSVPGRLLGEPAPAPYASPEATSAALPDPQLPQVPNLGLGQETVAPTTPTSTQLSPAAVPNAPGNPAPSQPTELDTANQQLQIDRLQEDLAHNPDPQKQQALDNLRQQQVDRAATDRQQQEIQKQQEFQALQAQIQELERQQQAERAAQEAAQMQPQGNVTEGAHPAEQAAAQAAQQQQALQAQQQELERQQQAAQEAQQQQALQAQQQELERQQQAAQEAQQQALQADRAAAEAQRQQEAERQQAQQNQRNPAQTSDPNVAPQQ